MRKILLSILLVPIFLTFATSRVSSSEVYTEQWRTIEVKLISTKVYGNPFADVDVTAVFSKPGKASITRPAFWDGHNTWRIRFAPPSTGTWRMTTNSSDATNAGLNNQSKNINVIPYLGSLLIYKHGFLKISSNGHYFTYFDGKPFFYLGDTHWMAMHERWNTCNYSNCNSQFKYEVNKRVNQGFTVWQTQWMKPHGGQHTSLNEEHFYDSMSVCNVTDVDLKGFQNIDRKMAFLADKGLVIASSIEWRFSALDCPDSFLSKYGRYWAARYGSYPMLWTVAQEVDGLYKNDPSNLNVKWKVVGKSLSENDDYKHPLTAHMISNLSPAKSHWRKLPFHNWHAAQIHGEITYDMARSFYESGKPIVEYENLYENFQADRNSNRRHAYQAYLGGWGYGYGVAGIWDDNYTCKPIRDSGTYYDSVCNDWYNGLHRTSGNEMMFAKNFFNTLSWWNFIPQFADGKWGTFENTNYARLSTQNNNVYLAYFFYNKNKKTGKLKNMDNRARYVAKWYNPRNGLYQMISKNIKPLNGQWNVPLRPDSEDWILLVTKQ